MNAKDVINIIREDLSKIRTPEQDTVSLDVMDNYLGQFHKDIEGDDIEASRNHEIVLTKFNAENARNIAHSKNVTAHDLEMFKSVMAAGQSALKSSMIINAGGAMALLAFTGKIWNTSTSMQVANSLTSSIFIFCIGILLASIASGTTYFGQAAFKAEKNKTGNVINIVTILLVLSSFMTFGYGAYTAAKSLGVHFGL